MKARPLNDHDPRRGGHRGKCQPPGCAAPNASPGRPKELRPFSGLPFAKSLKQFRFYSHRRTLSLNTAGEGLQPFRQLALVIQAPGAPQAMAGVLQSLQLLCPVSHPAAH
jgi:hypothetical protein